MPEKGLNADRECTVILLLPCFSDFRKREGTKLSNIDNKAEKLMPKCRLKWLEGMAFIYFSAKSNLPTILLWVSLL